MGGDGQPSENRPKWFRNINFFMSKARELIFFWYLWKFEEYITCGAVQRELSCVWMRCGAACGQGLRTRRSMRMLFLLFAPSLTNTMWSFSLNHLWCGIWNLFLDQIQLQFILLHSKAKKNTLNKLSWHYTNRTASCGGRISCTASHLKLLDVLVLHVDLFMLCTG